MSSSSRIHAWIAIIATAALAGCSSTVSIDGTEQGDDLTDPADPADPNGDPPSIIDPVGSPPNINCGDGTCDPPESCATCSQDCGPCGGGGCGNNVCTPNESCEDCPQDCGACPCAHATCSIGEALDATCDPCVAQICAVDPFCCDGFWDGLCMAEVGSICGTPCAASCGDGLCDASESCSSCSQDCGACPICGDGWCDWTESCGTCAADCGACPVCGDGSCDWTESCDICASDCGACAVCGNGQCELGEDCNGCSSDCGACVCHDACVVGPALDETCSTCVAQICAVDSFCCEAFWDGLCVSEVGSICGTPCAATCGDGLCDPASESCSTCAQDCGACPVCGDFLCDWTESCDTCASDCGACPVCGDGTCDWTEWCDTCASDCGACPVPVCGDFLCDWTESCDTCASDCGACPVCGDGTCDWTEWCDTCASDCGACSACGNGQCDPGEDCGSCAGDCGACPACPGTDLGSTSPQTVNGSTAGQANALAPSCGFSAAPEVTYSFTAPAAGNYELNTFGSAYDSVLEVRDGTCQGAALACNDDVQGLQSQVFVTLAAGQTVIVVVDGYASGQGAFTLNIL